jgi:hypothetical protein
MDGICRVLWLSYAAAWETAEPWWYMYFLLPRSSRSQPAHLSSINMAHIASVATTNTSSKDVVDSLVMDLEKSGLEKTSDTPSSLERSVSTKEGEILIASASRQQSYNSENFQLSHLEQFPIDPDAPEELQQFTFRAVFVGCCLGGVIAASK